MQQGSYIHINKWLLPLSHLYGLGVRLRNFLFDEGVLRSRAYDLPVISVGNITVGGTGKTPHVEYLIELLKSRFKVAVLSRGYKRKSHGYVLATAETTARDIGDEPYQIHRKYTDIYVAVDKKRTHGIERLTHDEATKDVQTIILDDAFQHRYVYPRLNILLVDYHRMIVNDRLLPAGRLREPVKGKHRADIVIVTKCPRGLKPMEYRVLTKSLDLYPYQQLFFTTMAYGDLKSVFGNATMPLSDIGRDSNLLLITGIAEPRPLLSELKKHSRHVSSMTFGDHHEFSSHDIEAINGAFAKLPRGSIIVTTEKDAARLVNMKGLSDGVQSSLFALPIKVKFLLEGEEKFNEKVLATCK